MVLSLSPHGVDRFRTATKKQIQVGAQKRCKGECNRQRSIRQFAEGSDLCLQCVRRTPKTVSVLQEKPSGHALPVNNSLTDAGAEAFAACQKDGK